MRMCGFGRMDEGEKRYCGWFDAPDDGGPMFLVGCQECADAMRRITPERDIWPPATTQQDDKV